MDDKGFWVFDKAGSESINLSYADNVEALDNIYKLDSDYKDILKAVSIFSIPVSSDVIENFVEIKGEKLINCLYYLSNINIIIRKPNDWGLSYSFNSLNLKRSIYENISSELRRKYHEKASYVLKSKIKNENKENADELIHQMLRANWNLEVREYLMDTAESLIGNNSINQAVRFLENAYGLLVEESIYEDRILVCNKLGELYERMGEYSKAYYYYNIVEGIARTVRNTNLLIDVYIEKYLLMYKLGDRKTSFRYLAQSKNLLRTSGYRKGIYEHIIVINRMMLHKRKFNSYIDILEKALKNMDKEQYKFYYARILGICGRLKAYKGRHEEGLSELAESVSILEKTDNYRKVLYPLNSMGEIYYDNYNEIQKAKECFERCLSISKKAGDAYYIGKSYKNLAEIYRTEDKNSKALQFYQSSLENITLAKDRHLEFWIYLNMALTNIELEDYKKALTIQNNMEEELMKSRYSGNLIDLYHRSRAEFFYAVGEYEKAQEYAQKSVDMCITWGITENYDAHFVKLLSEIQQNGNLDFERDSAFLDKVFTENLYKLGRIACVKLAEIYISRGMQERGAELLNKGLNYVSKIDTDMLRLRYEYAGALVKEGPERLDSLTNLAGYIETAENNELGWKMYKAIASEFIERKDYREALKCLIKSLSYLRKLVHNVPDEYKIRFINSHDRNTVKESLIRAAEILTSGRPGSANIRKTVMGRRLTGKRKESLNLHEIDKYFDYTEYRNIFRYNGTDEISASRSTDINVRMGFLERIQDLLVRFSDDERANLKQTISLLAEITQAKNAFIATLQEDDSLDVIASYNKYSEIPFYKYIIEQAKQKKDIIIINDAFEYNAGKGDILIPRDITAVFCIPLMTSKESDCIGIELEEERRRYRAQEDDTIIGYIYLDTDSIINNFTQESSQFCIMASNIAYILTDNYNMKTVSTVDRLTRLYTRKHFESMLSNELMRMEKEGGQFSIIMSDIDRFKNVNDRFGHQKGDEVLQNIGSIIMGSVRKGDICGRYGGEEIIILLPGSDAEGAYKVAEKIRKKVENSKLLGLNTPLTISLGISSYPEHSTWAKDLIDKADQALYHVKESGRNGSRIYEPNMSNSLKRIDRLEGIISGDPVEDQRKAKTLLEILELQRNNDKTVEEKMFNFLGRIIEASEAQTGGIFFIEETSDGGARIGRKILRKSLTGTEAEEIYYNEGILQKCINSKRGEYQIDWSGYPGIDSLTGMPDWQSVILIPMIDRGRLKGVAYLSVSIKNKEFDAGTYNYVKTLSDIMSAALRTE
ncbi:MAG TPA: diguanylate cyclase [Bacillota bacterium]|nr:diguanylate cyclase [Bacillota bacterium]